MLRQIGDYRTRGVTVPSGERLRAVAGPPDGAVLCFEVISPV